MFKYHHLEYSMERECGREADKARGGYSSFMYRTVDMKEPGGGGGAICHLYKKKKKERMINKRC